MSLSVSNENKLTPEQQQTLITYWDDATALYQHTKQKLLDITKLCRYTKLKQQMNVHIDDLMHDMKEEDDEESKESAQLTQHLEWNYLIICTEHLLQLNNENVSFHLLATQVYQSYPFEHDQPSHDKYLQRAIKSCDTGIRLCLLHLEGLHNSFFIWITTFYVLKAQILFQQRKWLKVIDCILPSLKYQQCENLHLLYNLRASAYCELKQFHHAIDDYGLAIDKSAEPSSYYNSRGTCWHELGEFHKALTDYNHAIQCNSKCVSAYNNRASLFVDMKEYEKALQDANKGLVIYENHGNLYKHRGLAHFHLGHYMQCLVDLQKSIKFAPQYRPARVTLKMLWDFYYLHVMKVTRDFYEDVPLDICVILVDYVVGDNYQTDANMVDATYADWKKEMAMIEEEKRRQQEQQQPPQEAQTNHHENDDDHKEMLET
eukprot:CAMPEP_0197020386 /NCGR_PEP_ID=MMETSP1384-20130603/1148_1 /TAXON_ID=29189 /ORGANISM="Ammonia sp." /LENGTH=430 /DNA_ID=CAMNT_0042447997 /DNA_START=32 /DNA_END=1324 /DNA_ORIENTATION=-